MKAVLFGELRRGKTPVLGLLRPKSDIHPICGILCGCCALADSSADARSVKIRTIGKIAFIFVLVAPL